MQRKQTTWRPGRASNFEKCTVERLWSWGKCVGRTSRALITHGRWRQEAIKEESEEAEDDKKEEFQTAEACRQAKQERGGVAGGDFGVVLLD